MQESSPVFAVAPDLLRDAASERGWPAVMKRLGLAPTEVNVRAFRLRAARLGIPVGHLRWHGGITAIPAEALAAAVAGAASRLEVLQRLGLQPGGGAYTDLNVRVKSTVSLCRRRTATDGQSSWPRPMTRSALRLRSPAASRTCFDGLALSRAAVTIRPCASG